MVNFVHDLTVWNWLIFGIMFLALELIWARGYCFWYAIFAGLVGFLQKVLPGFEGYAQVITFAILALLSTILWYRALQIGARLNRPGMENYNIAKTCMGKTFTLQKNMRKRKGKIQLEGRIWMLRAKENLKKGTEVKVTGHDGVILIVKRSQELVSHQG